MTKKFILLFVLMITVLFTGCTSNSDEIGKQEAKQKIEDYLKEIGTTGVTIQEVTDSDSPGLYLVKVNVNGEIVESFMTKDGNKFFQTAMDIDIENLKEQKQEAEQSLLSQLDAIPKQEKPYVELFVMSHCPYGTQIEKGILPVAETLGNKVDLDVKFCDYAMHQKPELEEQMRQYCIQSNYNDEQFLSYLRCFLSDKTKAQECMQENNFDSELISSCVTQTDQQYQISSGYEDQTTWRNGNYPNFDIHKEDVDKYSIQGSPTLIINGYEVRAKRSPDFLLKAVCAGYENPPQECEQTLSDEEPAPGFGWEGTVSGDSSQAQCN